MKRKMKKVDTGTVLVITEFFMTKNFWEYFVTDINGTDTETPCCLAMGFETELGDVSIEEVKPYIIPTTRVQELDGIMPPPGYKWED